jgi:hypothetical protein
MALVQCKECGTEVSDLAPVCPKCGVPNPAGDTCRVSVTRSRSFKGAANKTEICIDDMYAMLGNGETMSLDLAPGSHKIVLTCATFGTVTGGREERFDIHGGQTVNYECGFAGMGSLYLKRV